VFRISDADAASAAARELNRQRWGDTVVRRAAATLIDRADQVDAALRAEVLQALGQDGDDQDG